MDRSRRLELARHVDWRFLLPDPSLGAVGQVEPADELMRVALTAHAAELTVGSLDEMTRLGRTWDVVVVDRRHRDGRRASVRDALALVRPGGWLHVDLPRRSRLRGELRRVLHGLESAGAVSATVHWHLPNRERTTRIVPLSDAAAVRAALSGRGGTAVRRLSAAAVRALIGRLPVDLVAGDLAVLARRPGGPPLRGWGPLEALGGKLPDLGASHGPSLLMLTPRYRASAHVVLLMIDDGGRATLVAKVARLADDDSIAREADHLRAMADAGLGGTTPRLIATDRLGGHAVLVETGVVGQPLDRATVRRSPDRWIAAAAAWVSRMPSHSQLLVDRYDELIGEPLRRLSSTARAPVDALVERTAALVEPLRGRSIPLVYEHGDLGHPNVIVLTDGRIGVLDWETARSDGLPLHDLTFFLGYAALSTGPPDEEPAKGFIRVLETPGWGALDALRREGAHRGIPPSDLPRLIVAAWARIFTDLAERQGIGTAWPGDAGGTATNRYYAMWDGAARHYDRIAALLS